MLTPKTALRQSQRSISTGFPASGTLDTVLGKLSKARKQGRNWMACCPSHKDHTPSLSVGQGADGKLLLHCFAGCSFEAILGGLNLDASAFYNTEEPERTDNGKRAYPNPEAAIEAYRMGRPSKTNFSLDKAAPLRLQPPSEKKRTPRSLLVPYQAQRTEEAPQTNPRKKG